MILRRVHDPAGPAVPIASLKEHLRLSGTDDLLLVHGVLSAATGWVEQYIRRSLISQGWELTLDCWASPWIELPRAPILSVSEVRYLDVAGVPAVLAPTSYQLDDRSAPGRLAPAFGARWPNSLNQIASITIAYQAGYGASWNDVPEPIRHAIMMMAAHLYENREAVVVGTAATELPMAVHTILEPYRVWGVL